MHLRIPEDLKNRPLNICIDYKPKKIARAFNDKHIQYISEGGDEEIPIEKYLKNIRPYLHDMLNDLRKTGGQNIHRIMKINLMSSKCLIHSRSYKEEIMTRFDTEELIQELLNRFCIGIK